jgi:hypothetical protein
MDGAGPSIGPWSNRALECLKQARMLKSDILFQKQNIAKGAKIFPAFGSMDRTPISRWTKVQLIA